MTNTNDENIEDLSALEQYLKDYENRNSFSYSGNIVNIQLMK